jgi:hypothetical protein
MLRLFPCVIRQQFIRPANLQVQYPSILLRYHLHPKRGFANVPTVILPPVVFGGLLVALWTWKCFMMVLFQNKIIYMPGLPPSARRETIADYSSQCGGIQWREEKTTSQDGTRIHLCVASVDSGPVGETMKRVYILYFQGQSTILLRIGVAYEGKVMDLQYLLASHSYLLFYVYCERHLSITRSGMSWYAVATVGIGAQKADHRRKG